MRATNGPALRADARWRARATTSLPGPRLARQEDGRLGRRDLRGLDEDGPPGGRGADDPAEAVARLQLVGEGPDALPRGVPPPAAPPPPASPPRRAAGGRRRGRPGRRRGRRARRPPRRSAPSPVAWKERAPTIFPSRRIGTRRLERRPAPRRIARREESGGRSVSASPTIWKSSSICARSDSGIGYVSGAHERSPAMAQSRFSVRSSERRPRVILSWGRTRRAIAETWSKTSRTSRALARAGPSASSSRWRRSLFRSSSARRSCSRAAERMSAIALAASSSRGAEPRRRPRREPEAAERERRRGRSARRGSSASRRRAPRRSARRAGSRTARASSIRRVPVAGGPEEVRDLAPLVAPLRPAGDPGVASSPRQERGAVDDPHDARRVERQDAPRRARRRARRRPAARASPRRSGRSRSGRRRADRPHAGEEEALARRGDSNGRLP